MENEAALKKKFIAALGSEDGRITLDATYWLGQHGWLSDGTLKDARLTRANLYEAALQEADLRSVILDGANLYSADLFDANLEGASLVRTDLRETYLYGTNLRNANLRWAKLEGAFFDERMMLPDGTQWTEATDMARFTNPHHPDFWDADVKGVTTQSEIQMQNGTALKKQLIAEFGSADGGIAGQALYWLNEHGWVKDGSLRNAKLMGADLFEAFLNGGVDLSGVDLSGASLHRADLTDSNLENATLIQADLRGSLLFGTKLLNVNLREANLEDAVFDENTILPDGTHWTEDTDMTRFTDPNHPDFWDASAKNNT